MAHDKALNWKLPKCKNNLQRSIPFLGACSLVLGHRFSSPTVTLNHMI